jgi:hypothetical protein
VRHWHHIMRESHPAVKDRIYIRVLFEKDLCCRCSAQPIADNSALTAAYQVYLARATMLKSMSLSSIVRGSTIAAAVSGLPKLVRVLILSVYQGLAARRRSQTVASNSTFCSCAL